MAKTTTYPTMAAQLKELILAAEKSGDPTVMAQFYMKNRVEVRMCREQQEGSFMMSKLADGSVSMLNQLTLLTVLHPLELPHEWCQTCFDMDLMWHLLEPVGEHNYARLQAEASQPFLTQAQRADETLREAETTGWGWQRAVHFVTGESRGSRGLDPRILVFPDGSELPLKKGDRGVTRVVPTTISGETLVDSTPELDDVQHTMLEELGEALMQSMMGKEN